MILGIAALAALFFGVGFLGVAIAAALEPRFGVAGGYAIAGGIFAGPVLLWALIVSLAPRPERRVEQKDFMTSLFRAVAQEAPWGAVASAALVGIVNLFLSRHKRKK
ncbi:MAG TPA: hypothetical protein VG501_07780 [Rhizomicrobium sp.]|nr:hypothetical protein [Rhizomicrobium sp.]